MSGQNFDEINQILKRLKNNQDSKSCEKKQSNRSCEPKTSCEKTPSNRSCEPKTSCEKISSNRSCEPKSSHHHVNYLTKDCEGNVKITGELAVCENVCIDNELRVDNISAKDCEETLYINSNTHINNSLCIDESLIVDTIESQSGSCVNIQNINVENINFDNNDSTCNTGNIIGNVNLTDNLYVNGTITSCSGIKTNNLTVGGQLTLCDKLKVPNFEVCGNTILGNNLTCNAHKTQVNGNLCVSNRLEVWDECDSLGENVIIEKGNVCVGGELEVDVIKSKNSDQPICIDGELVVSNNCDSTNDVKISNGCVDAQAFVGSVDTIDLNVSTPHDVSNLTTLIVLDGDSTNNTISLSGGREGQLLVVINKSNVEITIDSVKISVGSSRVIVFYDTAWH